MKAIFTLSKLTPEEKNLLKTKQVQANMPPQQWIDLFSKLRDFDKEADSSRLLAGWMIAAGVLITIVGIPLTAILIGFVIIPIGIILAGTFLYVFFSLKQYDIKSEILSGKVLPTLLVLREEMKPGDGLKLRLDLRGFEIPEKLVNQSPKRNTSIYRSIVDYYYRDNWMDGDATLADGTRLVWNAQELVKHIKKVKYRKGKRKSKSKFRSVLTTQIGMHRKRYRLPAVREKGNDGKIATRKSGEFHWMRISKTIKHPPGQTFKPTDFLNTVATAYSRAIPAGGPK